LKSEGVQHILVCGKMLPQKFEVLAFKAKSYTISCITCEPNITDIKLALAAVF